MVMEQEDSGDGSMTCTDHPYKNKTPGGICAFCLQEKLGKLVSSSFPVAVFPTNSSSSSSPSFGSDTTTAAATASSALTTRTIPSQNVKKSRLPFLLPNKNKKKLDTHSRQNNNKIVLSRSKSTVIPRRANIGNDLTATTYSAPHHNKRKFFSFLYLTKLKPNKKLTDVSEEIAVVVDDDSTIREVVVEKDDVSPGQLSFDRKVSRSRSVGCGSRSFSGDFFERISTGFGDCTLRRVESQREGKARVRHGGGGGGDGGGGGGGRGQGSMKERVKCGGLFSGFMITSSSSSSSSNWVSENNGNGKAGAVVARQVAHARSRSWGWTFASPMKAFSKNSSAKRVVVVAGGNKSNGGGGGGAPNLNAIPSILAVRS